MAGPKDRERGTRSPLHLRAGVDVPGFVGAQVKLDPSMIPPNAFQEAINARILDRIPVCRGGQSKEITTPIADEWDSLYDAGGAKDGGLSLWLAADRPVLPPAAEMSAVFFWTSGSVAVP